MEDRQVGYILWAAGIVLAALMVMASFFTMGISLLCCPGPGMLMFAGSTLIILDMRRRNGR